jgi:hypothetical protein
LVPCIEETFVDSTSSGAGVGQPPGRKPHPRASYGLSGTSYRRTRFRWDGDRLMIGSGHLIATVEPDSEWPGLWRVRLPDGRLSDMVNRTRAKDAAETLALVVLNREEVSAEAA